MTGYALATSLLTLFLEYLLVLVEICHPDFSNSTHLQLNLERREGWTRGPPSSINFRSLYNTDVNFFDVFILLTKFVWPLS
jgi:hypothetical protein